MIAARFADPSDDDHSCYIWIAALLMLGFTTLTLALRLWTKYRKYTWDDASILLGLVFAYGQFGTVAAGLAQGMGRKWSLIPGQAQDEIAVKVTAAQVLYILCLGFLKLGVVWPVRGIYRRLRRRWAVIICHVVLGAAAVWTIASIIILSINCSPNHILPKTAQDACSYGVTRWGFVMFFDSLTEVCLVPLAVHMLSGLEIGIEEKATVLVAFALRIGVIVFAIKNFLAQRQAFLTRTDHESAGTALAYTEVQVWQDVEICYSLVTATLPFALRFMRNFESGGLTMMPPDMNGVSKLASRAGTELSSIAPRSVRRPSTQRMPSLPNDLHCHDKPIAYAVTITSPEQDSVIDPSLSNHPDSMSFEREDHISIRYDDKNP